jgi:hypothetical protein
MICTNYLMTDTNFTTPKLCFMEALCQGSRHKATNLSTWYCSWLLGILYLKATAAKLFINLSVCLLVENWRVLCTVLLLRMCSSRLLHISMPLSLLHKRYKRITFCGDNLGICTVPGSKKSTGHFSIGRLTSSHDKIAILGCLWMRIGKVKLLPVVVIIIIIIMLKLLTYFSHYSAALFLHLASQLFSNTTNVLNMVANLLLVCATLVFANYFKTRKVQR